MTCEEECPGSKQIICNRWRKNHRGLHKSEPTMCWIGSRKYLCYVYWDKNGPVSWYKVDPDDRGTW